MNIKHTYFGGKDDEITLVEQKHPKISLKSSEEGLKGKVELKVYGLEKRLKKMGILEK